MTHDIKPTASPDLLTRPGILLGLFLLLSLWALWPLPQHLLSAIPTGSRTTSTVPGLNAWIIWWNAESLSHGLVDYWNAPIFYPATGSLAFSEPQPATLLLAPVVYVFGSPIPAYNFYAILALALNGFFATRILLRCGGLPWCAVAGGVAMTFHPAALDGSEAIQLLSVWPMLWTFDALLAFRKAPNGWRAAVAGLSFACTAMLCLHHALFLAVILVTCGCTLVPSSTTLARWFGATGPNNQDAPGGHLGAVSLGIAVSAVVASCLLLPWVLPMQRIHNAYQLARGPQVVAALSADLADWSTTPARSLAPVRSSDNGDFPLLPGILRLTLAILTIPLSLKSNPRFTILFSSVALVSFTLSFGSNLALGQLSLWTELAGLSETLARIRSPYRFAYLAQLAILLLAALGTGELVRLLFSKRKVAGMHRHLPAYGLAACLLGIVAIEVPPPQSLLAYPPRPQHSEAWVKFIAEETPAGEAILCLPVAHDISESANQQETTWMMYATLHRIPLLNGYSGFSPPGWKLLRRRLANAPLSSEALSAALDAGAFYVVIRKDRYASSSLDTLRNLELAAPVFEDARFLILGAQTQAND